MLIPSAYPKAVKHWASKDVTRVNIQHVKVTPLDDNRTRFESTDGTKLVRVEVEDDGNPQGLPIERGVVLIHPNTLTLAAKIAGVKGTVRVSRDGYVYASPYLSDAVRFPSTDTAGLEWPDTDRIIPEGNLTRPDGPIGLGRSYFEMLQGLACFDKGMVHSLELQPDAPARIKATWYQKDGRQIDILAICMPCRLK